MDKKINISPYQLPKVKVEDGVLFLNGEQVPGATAFKLEMKAQEPGRLYIEIITDNC